MSYVPEEWAVAHNPAGGWVILGAPQDSEGQCYRVVWPVPTRVQPLVAEYRDSVWTHPEFVGVIGAINSIIDGIKDVGEYKPEPAFNLADWVASYEGVQSS